MVVLLGLHMLQVVIAGAQLPPREINWWLGLALMGAILGLSLTGYLLPWDQKGYWATQVATSIAGNLPGIGSFVKRVLVGGPEYGNHTLTRFYALHVGVLPPLIIVLLVMHIVLFRRHGVTAPKDAEGEGWFWPDQAFKDLLACLAIFGVLLGVVVFGGQGNKQEPPKGAQTAEVSLYEKMAHGGRDGRGANLDAPADPQEQYPARPEWYFLFLFQLLKYYEGDLILIGTVVIPNGVGVVLFLLPLLGYGAMRPFGHVVGVIVVTAVLAAAGSLTCLALADDNPDPLARVLLEKIAFIAIPVSAGVLLTYLGLLGLLPKGGFRRVVYVGGVVVLTVLALMVGGGVYGALSDAIPEQARAELAKETTETASAPSEKTTKALAFRKQVEHAEASAARAVQIAQPPSGIPEGGAALLLRRDPMTTGKKLFKQHCAVCHYYKGVSEPGDKITASDLTDFGTKEWIRALLENAGDDRFFGHTNLTGMRGWSNKHREYRQGLQDDIDGRPRKDGQLSTRSQAELKKELADYDAWVDGVAGWLATHPVGDPKAVPKTAEEKKFAEGYALFDNQKIKRRCSDCHSFGGKEPGEAPDLTGYGSADWARLMIVAPGHPLRYGTRNGMPAFRNEEGAGSEILLQALAKEAGEKYIPLSDVDRELILRFLTRDERLVFFGRPITGPDEKKKN
jgi:ubiquinol-cytochrome c reductase cytochrome b subunit